MDDPSPDVDAIRTITVLSVSRFEEDHLSLERIFHDFEVTLYPNCRLRLIRCSMPASALSILRGARIPIVVCDADERPTVWERMARELQGLSEPPCLILSSWLADDHLCMEAAKHGAYEVLAKPFHGSEVLRVVNLVWRHWQDRYGFPAAAPQVRQPSAGAQSAPRDVDNPVTEVRKNPPSGGVRS